jgi:hypothetical protein
VSDRASEPASHRASVECVVAWRTASPPSTSLLSLIPSSKSTPTLFPGGAVHAMTLPGGNRNPPRARGKRGIGGSIGSAMGTTTRSGPGPTRLGLVAILVLSFCSTARAALLQPSYRSCLSSYSPIASGNGLLNITGVYAELVSAQEAAKIGLQQGTQGVLRVDLIGVTGEELVGYDNTTNKLGKCVAIVVVEEDVLGQEGSRRLAWIGSIVY